MDTEVIDLSGGTPAAGAMFDLNINAMRPYTTPEAPGKEFITVVNAQKEKEAKLVGAANATTLTRDEWELIDQEIQRETRDRLAFVNWLVGKGCTIDLPDAMATTQYTWQKVTGSLTAQMDMDGMVQNQGNRPVYSEDSTIIPIVSAGWNVNLRHLAQSRKAGIPLDTYLAGEAVRTCTEFVENMMVNGTNSFTFAGKTLYGLADSTALNAIDESVTGFTTVFKKSWDTATGAEIIADVKAMVTRANTDRYYGPFTLWLPQKYELVLASDYTSNYEKTIKDRIMEMGMISEIKFSDYITTDSNSKDVIFLVAPRKNLISVIRGMEFTDFMETRNIGWSQVHKVAGIYVPLIRKDASGKSGIIKATLDAV